MKYIILAAGKGIDSFSEEKNLPKCLLKFDNKTVIDNIFEIASSLNISDINLIGGYEILKIMSNYPSLKYFYNEKWENTNSLYSLFKILKYLDDDILISYSDTIYSKNIVKKMIFNKKEINIAYDSLWEKRYEGRETKNNEIEKIFSIKNKLSFSKKLVNNNFLGEYAGLVYIPKNKIKDIKIIIEKIIIKNEKASILCMLDSLSINDNKLNLIDIKGNWAELDSIQDLEHFKFGTKAETLNSLKDRLRLSKILDQYTFIVKDFLSNSQKIINEIQKNLDTKLLIVRSSALNEDTHNSSMAGNYESVLKVSIDNKQIIKESILEVINSYTKNNQKQNKDNQILVQPYIENVSMSGVVFTKNLQTSSPYYIINYDESEDTESVTSGNGENLNTFVCYRNFEENIKNQKLSILIKAVKEIESITKYDAIDIEFAFVEQELYILQVRPIAAHKDSLKVLETDVSNELFSLKEFIIKQKLGNQNLLGQKFAYGVMPDWNPAEIIGINPKPLSFDLYKYIITDSVWAQSRKKLGYRNVENSVGIVSFLGKPYVDVKMSFNTFIPADLDEEISSKLVNYFIDKLQDNPQNHDKVEFNVAITAFDFNFDKKEVDLKKYGFNIEEISKIVNCYKTLTENIINEKNISIESEINKSIELKRRRENIDNSNLSISDKIYSLLEDCKRYGTLPFSNLARFGFVGSIFLKSLLSKNILDESQYDDFFKSIHTIAKSFIDDFGLLSSNILNKKDFIDKYGHLRPGTYDVESLTYKENFDNYIDVSKEKLKTEEVKSAYIVSKELKQKIDKEILSYNLNFSTDKLLNFIVKSTEARELSKFEFTKNLSLVLDLIIELSDKYNISREDAGYLNLNNIIKYSNSTSTVNIEKYLLQSVSENKKKYLLTSAIQLPELIFDTRDIEMFFYSKLKPNFVTHHNIVSTIVVLNDSGIKNIENKIIFIENADPGFDWIFSHNIKGIITKYGGAASHMAIRCAEFDLPAAIGCGDEIYNELIKFNTIKLDCVNHTIKGIS